MNMLVAKIKHHLNVYRYLLSFTLRAMLEYRLNFVVQMLYGPAYVLILYLILRTALSHTPTLFGWSHPEIILLFSSYHLLYSTCTVLFIKSCRHMLGYGIRLGEVDTVLTKPLSSQFLLTMQKPELQQILLVGGLLTFFVHNLSQLNQPISALNFTLFCISWLTGILTCYFVLTSYAASGFFVSRAVQVIEFFDKLTDFAQYPTPIFPQSIQLIFTTIVPAAFFGYVPVLFLLGKGSWQWLTACFVICLVSFSINRLVWRYALRAYASASS